MPLEPKFWGPEEPEKPVRTTHIGENGGPYRCGITELPKGHLRISMLPHVVHPGDRCPGCYHDYTDDDYQPFP
jgi:hypothetical protein